MKDENTRGWYIWGLGVLFIVISLIFHSTLPEYGVASNLLQHPEYHYAVNSSRLGLLFATLGTVIWIRDNWRLLFSVFATNSSKEVDRAQ